MRPRRFEDSLILAQFEVDVALHEVLVVPQDS